MTKDGADNNVVRFTHSMADVYVLREIHLTIYKNSSKNSEVIIYQHPAIELKKLGAGDVFVDGYFAYVTDARNRSGQSFGTAYTDNGRTFYHSSAGTWRNGYLTPPTPWTYTAIASRSAVSQGVSTDFFTTDITITAFDDGKRDDGTVDEDKKNDTYTIQETTNTSWSGLSSQTYSYKIGDPRVTASSVYGSGWSLRDFSYDYTNNTDRTEAWQSPGDIKICGQDTNNRNMIAPHLLVSSGLNFMQDAISFRNVVERAAVYQEVGYPAGRWRLPSEAEIAFIYARQQDGTIPNLFANSTEYWAGSGRVVRINNGNLQFKAASSSQTYRARFVYDLWYWGDEPMSTNQYHANAHIEN